MSENIEIVPLQQPGLADYHCHCDYSVDAQGSVDEYCEAALRRGLAEICFTTHYDWNPDTDPGDCCIVVNGKQLRTSSENIAPYVRDVRRVHDKYYPLGLSVQMGIEFGWYNECEEEVHRLQDLYAFDYLLCGIHEIDAADCSADYRFKERLGYHSVESLIDQWAAKVIRAASTRLFNTIAHLDYVRLAGLPHFGTSLDDAIKSRLPDIFVALKESDTALEVNTAGHRHGLNDYYPQIEIINRARRAGVDIRYLGSDAHQPRFIGFDFDAAAIFVPQALGGCESF